jgi:hypothetical protein
MRTTPLSDSSSSMRHMQGRPSFTSLPICDHGDERERDVLMPHTSASRVPACYRDICDVQRALAVATSFSRQPSKGDLFFNITSCCAVVQSERLNRVPPQEPRSQTTRSTARASLRRPQAARTSGDLQQSHHRLRHALPSPPPLFPSTCKSSTLLPPRRAETDKG